MSHSENGRGEVTSIWHDPHTKTVAFSLLGRDLSTGNWATFTVTFGPSTVLHFIDQVKAQREALEQPTLPF